MSDKGLIPQIRKAEARVKVLKHELEVKTGLKEAEALVLDKMTSLEWVTCMDLVGLVYAFSKTHEAFNGIRRKAFADVRMTSPKQIHINAAGREALALFKKELE